MPKRQWNKEDNKGGSPHKKRKAIGSKDTRPTISDSPTQKIVSSSNAALTNDEAVNFPRGGGSGLSKFELKVIRSQASRDVEQALVKSSSSRSEKNKMRLLAAAQKAFNAKDTDKGQATIAAPVLPEDDLVNDSHVGKIHQLGFENISVGHSVLCQVTFIHPLALIASLPNGLTGHIPITQISPTLTHLLVKRRELLQNAVDINDNAETDGDDETKELPHLSEMFSIRQYIPAVVTGLHGPGQTVTASGKDLQFLYEISDENVKGCARIELSIAPDIVNEGVSDRDVVEGSLLSGAIKSVEDHGYIVDFGINSLSGFLPNQVTPAVAPVDSLSPVQNDEDGVRLFKGQVLFIRVISIAPNRRIATLALSSLGSSTVITDVSQRSSIIPGSLVSGRITSMHPDGLVLQICSRFGGTVTLYHTGSPNEIKDLEETFKLEKSLGARILWKSSKTFGVSLLPHILALEPATVSQHAVTRPGNARKAASKIREEPSPTKVALGVAYPIGAILEHVSVIRVNSTGLACEIVDKQGRSLGVPCDAHMSNISSTEIASLSSTSGPYKLGSRHKARVISISHIEGLLLVSLKESDIKQAHFSMSDVRVGEIVEVTIKSISTTGIVGSISDTLPDVTIPPLHYADVPPEKLETRFKIGEIEKGRVLTVDPGNGRITLTFKETLLSTDLPLIMSVGDVQKGMLSHGVILHVGQKSASVAYFGGVKAIIPINEAGDEPLTLGQIVRTRVIRVDQETVIASVRRAAPKFSLPSDVATIPVGSPVHGRVSEILSQRIMINLEPSGVRALARIGRLSRTWGLTPEAVKDSVKIGDELDNLKVVDTNSTKGFVVVEATADTTPIRKGTEQPSTHVAAEEVGFSGPTALDAEREEADHSRSGDDQRIPKSDGMPSLPGVVRSEEGGDNFPLAPLQIESGFNWGRPSTSNDVGVESSSEEEDADAETRDAKSRKKRRKKIQMDMTVEMLTKTPQSTADFERVLLGSPNSSFLWIQFMSFQLQLSEVEKARQIARRALNTINFREGKEKLNVWIAYLNLEITFGTNETMEAVFADACRYNDSKTVHLRFAAILDGIQKHEKAEDIYKRAAKKFSRSSKVYTLLTEHYLKKGMFNEARNLLPRSLKNLEKRKHLKTILRTAQLEYSCGEPERGRTLFEGIVDSYPKRLDLWSVYIDMEASKRNMDFIRLLFDRILSQKLNNVKAKNTFKKWLALEKRVGTKEGEDAVKSRAIAWTQSSTGS
ncbi:uncharacterized protein EI90DRAFT_3041094 [Cantharellus anzutake]|uniref:uncharacterized protein n=1 Tax=Cantharellus anzutake TaxID=1750568 RepID=UPI0019039683|nr:uncharacterized protein EI90DRAFT_3041094 [Cantharellus anzutake]KAF8337933.1 hypothetical protein EI90DRAFT_3041094 [Cantharellus anzutake]